MMGISIKDFIPKDEENADKELDISNLPKDKFTLEDIKELWNAKLNELEEEGKSHILGAIKNADVQLEEENVVQFIFHTKAATSEFDKFKQEWASKVKNTLNNFHIQFTVKVEITENNTPVSMSPEEVYKEMLKKNPNLELLRKKMGLDFYS